MSQANNQPVFHDGYVINKILHKWKKVDEY